MLSVGNYKTRDERDVKIVAIEDNIAIGYIVQEGIGGVTTWSADTGRYWIDSNDEDCNDIIDTKPRIKGEVWLTIYNKLVAGFLIGGGYSTKDEALERRGAKCIAIVRVEIDCVRGENLE